MANQQGGSMGGQQRTNPDQPTGRQSPSTGQTGVRDSTYNLISVVYHALQGAETYKMYEEDVERTQDAELAQFFRQAHEEEKRRAQQGKELLQRHLQRQQGGSQQLQGGASSQQQGGSARSGQQSQSGSSSGQMGSSLSSGGQQSQSGSADSGSRSRSSDTSRR